jgi:hypothetical protein
MQTHRLPITYPGYNTVADRLSNGLRRESIASMSWSRQTLSLLFSLAVGSLLLGAPARADTLLQTATLGPTGQGLLFSTVIDSINYVGARFQTTQSFTLTDVQIHAATFGTGNNLLFAAIVPVTSLSSFPSSTLIANSNPVEFHTFTAPVSNSALITIPFTGSLPAGFFALVFGSGEFGATGGGIATQNNPDIGSPAYLVKLSNQYFNVGAPNFHDMFFAVHGTTGVASAAPEPASLALLTLSGLPVVGAVIRRRHIA